MTALLVYLILGALVAWANDALVLHGHTGGVERVTYWLRALLAWPTYLLEDFIFWFSADDEDC